MRLCQLQPAQDHEPPPLGIRPHDLHKALILPALHGPALRLQGRTSSGELPCYLLPTCSCAAARLCMRGRPRRGVQGYCRSPPARGARRGYCCAAAPCWLAGLGPGQGSCMEVAGQAGKLRRVSAKEARSYAAAQNARASGMLP